MKIGMLLNAPYPSDVRVKKETDALITAGFHVFLLCLRRAGEKTEETINGLSIQRIDAGRNDVQLAFWDVIMSITFVHPVFKKKIPGWIQKNEIQILHVHDLPLVGTALSVKKNMNVKVIADFHENYPDALRTWFEWTKNPVARLKNNLFMRYERWVKHEKRAVDECDHIIAVVDEMKDRLVNNHKTNPEKITVITNTEDHSFIEQPLDPEVYKDFKSKFVIAYSGGIGPHRGVDTAIEGMQYLKDKEDIVFVLIGSGGKAIMNSLKKMVSQYDLQQKVFFLGYQHFSKFYSYMHFANINVIPHKSNGHTDNTVPHKLFQGMMVGTPLLVSSSAPLKRYISNTRSGLIFEAGNPKDFANNVLRIYNDLELQNQLGKNGIKASTEGGLNWETTQKKLINLYNSYSKTT
jgi:glycosyltransferase involved in cell wall biosynthesis